MDITDYKILEILQENSRISMSALGRQVGLSSPSVTERVKRLEESGVIEKYTVSINAQKIYRPIRAYVLISITSQRRPYLLQLLQESGDVVWVDIIAGKYTLLAYINTYSTDHLMDLISRIQRYGETETSIAVNKAIPAKALKPFDLKK